MRISDGSLHAHCCWNSTCAFLLESYLRKVNLKLGENHFIFFPLKKSGENISKSNKILSYSSYRDIVIKLIKRIGLDPKDYGTHSLRSGGATQLAPNVTELELLTTGRWRDARSIRSYVEMTDSSHLEISNILQLSISNP